MLKKARELVATMRQERKANGWKGLFKRYGWRLVVGFILFYLVRDTLLYIVLPYAILKGACAG